MATTVTSPRLAAIAEGDPDLQPYVELLQIALAEAENEVWGASAAEVLARSAPLRMQAAEPVLNRAAIALPRANLEALYEHLRQHAAQELPNDLDLTHLVDALRMRPTEGPLGTLLQLTLLPPLMAAGKSCAPAVSEGHWTAGICPVCAAWPALAESRGLERIRVLRCGRCATEWTLPWLLCPFCANDDHTSLSYLTSEQTGEARRVFACDRCQGYLKTIATITPIDPLAVPIEDLATLELDVAALDAGRQRPTEPGFDLNVELRWA